MLRGKSNLLSKNVINRIGSGGHLGMAQRYHVRTFFVVDNIPNQIGYLIVIDGGNGQVLYISDGQPIGIRSLINVRILKAADTVREDGIEGRKAKRGR